MAMFLLPWAVALVQVLRHHHLDLATVTLLASVSLGLPALWLAWAGYRDSRRSASPVGGLSMAQVADQLALSVGKQWEAEAAVRRLNDPYPLPVSWGPADGSLTDSWDLLVRLATSGAGWLEPSVAGTWATGPDGLTGEGNALVNVLARVPTGRLVVLGEPGAGKTMLMVRLVLDLLKRRASGGPVPILASVGSWNPAGQDLREWLSAQLVIDHPALAATPPVGTEESTQAAALLAAGLILPVLDGLDEIPERVRGPAINRINDALRPGGQLVVTCRSRQYRDAVRPQNGVEVALRGAAAVQLRPLDAGAVREYLREDAGPLGRARWDLVFTVLGTKAPAGQALETPLMVGLARAIYNPRPGEQVGALRDPAELCDPGLTDRTAVESLLFDAFIPAAYRHNPAGRWTTENSERWLTFLARHLERKIAGPNLVLRQLPLALWNFGSKNGIPPRLEAERRFSEFAWINTAPDIGAAASPATALAWDRSMAIFLGVMGGAVYAVFAGLLGWYQGGPVTGAVYAAWTWLVAGLVGTFFTAWPWYEITRVWLALWRRLPWQLLGFLADAHKRGVLRQAGAVYQFRHIELQHRLVTRSSHPSEGS